jgi:hypothetical protein
VIASRKICACAQSRLAKTVNHANQPPAPWRRQRNHRPPGRSGPPDLEVGVHVTEASGVVGRTILTRRRIAEYFRVRSRRLPVRACPRRVATCNSGNTTWLELGRPSPPVLDCLSAGSDSLRVTIHRMRRRHSDPAAAAHSCRKHRSWFIMDTARVLHRIGSEQRPARCRMPFNCKTSGSAELSEGRPTLAGPDLRSSPVSTTGAGHWL